jgi:hypothetical protein
VDFSGNIPRKQEVKGIRGIEGDRGIKAHRVRGD